MISGYRSLARWKVSIWRRTLLGLAAALALTGIPALAAAASPEYEGLSLSKVLLDLQARGLKIAFTSHLVRPEMKVLKEPSSDEPGEILSEILAPHGLMAQKAAASELWVVVPDPDADRKKNAGIVGRVIERKSSTPLPGARILLPALSIEKLTGADGAFAIPGVPPGIYTVEAHLPGFVVEKRSGITLTFGRETEVDFALEIAPVPLDEIVVTPSRATLLRSDPVSSLALDRDEVLALPHLGDDLFRALSLLPGISGNELSAQFSIRGGRPDEVLVILDELELLEPFHLKDFNSALSIVAPRAVAEVDLIVGGFPAEYGDRMGGVLEMSTEGSGVSRHSHLGLALLSAQASNAGTFDDGKGNWLGVVRRGGTELAQDYLDDEERPRFWDAFGKVERDGSESQRIGVRVLHADDDLDVDIVDDDGEATRTLTGYGNSYLWLTHQALLSHDLFLNSTASVGRVRRDRNSEEDDPEDEEAFTIADHRTLDVAGLKQGWSFTRRDHVLKWGLDIRRLEAEYDYLSNRDLEDQLSDIRTNPRSGITSFQGLFKSDRYSLYVSDRMRLSDPFTLEVGLRYDESSITADRNLSPRLNLAYALGERSVLRAAWGHYFQSQRIYELQVEDGVTELARAERTEAFGIGFEHASPDGTTLRLNAYHRDVKRPRSRWENVIEPVAVFPEIEPDRVRLAPEKTTSRGVEVFLRSRLSEKIDGWASYAYARVEDEIDRRDVPRGIDQPHTFNIDLNYRATPRWTLNLAWRYHTGWPTTAVFARLEEDEEGELETVFFFGPINDERLSDYHRLDLRVSHKWQWKRGELTFFLELQNLYDRENTAGFDADFDSEIVDGRLQFDLKEEAWGSFLPSFGIDWEF